MLLKIKAHILYISGPQCFGSKNWFHGRQFFHGPGVGGMLSGWFKLSIFIVHFISNLMFALIWQEVKGQAQSLGTPGCICSNTLQGHYGPSWCVISLAVSSINPTWLPTDLLLVIFGRRHWHMLPACQKFVRVSIGIRAYVYILWVLIDIGKISLFWWLLIFGSKNSSFHKCKNFMYIFV